MSDHAPAEAIGAHWETSTGAGDDVLHAHCHALGLEVDWRVTAARLRGMAEHGELDVFGPCEAIVTDRLALYRLAHEPALAADAEATARGALAARRELAAIEARARRMGLTE